MRLHRPGLRWLGAVALIHWSCGDADRTDDSPCDACAGTSAGGARGVNSGGATASAGAAGAAGEGGNAGAVTHAGGSSVGGSSSSASGGTSSAGAAGAGAGGDGEAPLVTFGMKGSSRCEAFALSADGSTAVGECFAPAGASVPSDRAFRFTRARGVELLFPDETRPTAAYGVSADGSVILGYGHDGAAYTSFLLRGEAREYLPIYGVALSDDGGVVLGADGEHGVLWQRERGVTSLEPGIVSGLSGDGSCAVGYVALSDSTLPGKWDRDGRFSRLDVPLGSVGMASSANRDCSVIAGWLSSEGAPRAVVWRNGALVMLAAIAESFVDHAVVSGDGAWVVANTDQGAMLWDLNGQVRSLAASFASAGSESRELLPNDLSDDGRGVAGRVEDHAFVGFLPLVP